MGTDWALFAAAGCAAILMLGLTGCGASQPSGNKPAGPAPEGWKITSPAFRDGETIPREFTCDNRPGWDQPPTLSWTQPPEGTKSLALVVDDPDATAGTFTHWLLYGLAPEARTLTSDEAVAAQTGSGEGLGRLKGGGQHGTNDFGTCGWRGPCPPPGKPHHYHFKLLALNLDMNVSRPVNRREFDRLVAGHIIAQTEMVGVYQRR